MARNRTRSQTAIIESKLTSEQRFLLKHLEGCEARGETLKGYAQRKGLSAHGHRSTA